MGQPVPISQPEDSDASPSRCGQTCGCEPKGRVPESDGEAGGEQLSHPNRTDGEERGVPFVVQSGREMFMVACEASQWVLAELVFDTASCTFVETSRARYDWPGEAFGSMLARVAVGEEIDRDLIDRVTADFSRWLASQFIIVRRP